MDGNHLWLLIVNSVSNTLSALVEAFEEELDKGAGQQ